MALMDYLSTRRSEIEAHIKALRAELAEIRIAEAALSGEGVGKTVVTTPKGPAVVREGSIKDWILRALTQAPEGLYTEGVITAIQTIGGPEVARSSITPQLSRLKAEGLVTYEVNKWWLLSRSDRNEETPDASTSSVPVPEWDIDDEVPF